MKENKQKGIPLFAPGCEPVPFTQEQLDEASKMIDAHVTYAHTTRFGGPNHEMIQMRFSDRFISHVHLCWYAKEHDLNIDTIYSISDDKTEDNIQVNFRQGWEDPFE